ERVFIDNSKYDSLPMCGIEVRLPVGLKPYPSQKLMMVRLITSITKRLNFLAESPTGSVKQEPGEVDPFDEFDKQEPQERKGLTKEMKEPKVEKNCICLPKARIYYGTRTHKQIGQVVKEFARLPYGGVIRHTILASREQSCVNKAARNSGDISGTCKELTSTGG
ncbi:hypothetical protein TELCIR_23028, partial [Teladorsagia circumcincta]